MSTGIVEELDGIREIRHEADFAALTICASTVLDDVRHDDSIAINGVCLAVVEFGDDLFDADLIQETLDRLSLGQIEVDSRVSLEHTTTVGQHLGGHTVQGHTDSTGKVISRTPGKHREVMRIPLPEQLSKYVMEKDSIAMDGTSLAVSTVDERFFKVSLIPATLTNSIISSIVVDAKVSLEVDVLTKYVEKILER